MAYPRSPYDTVGGIVYFGRMLDKIRLHASGQLHPDLHANLGIHFDKRCADFLQVGYAELAALVRAGLGDEEALQWCFQNGRQPTSMEIEIWNGFMRKIGWRDPDMVSLERRKRESGFDSRAEIQTMFDYLDADEGREVRP